MGVTDPRRELRGAVYRGDGAAIIAVLGQYPAGEWLQAAGEGLLIALEQETPGARETAARWVEELRERDWVGDAELADHLAAELGTTEPSTSRPLPVALDQLSEVLEGDPRFGGGRIDLRTGVVWPQSVLDDGLDMDDEDDDEDADDEERWLTVFCEGSRDGYRDMELFVETIENPGRRDRLSIALQGRGAFRRFKDVLARWPAEFTRWHAFSEERRRGRARAWLADAGYRVDPRGDQPP
jgi:hypothetical protein